MTDKERLEEIKEKYMEHEYDFNLIKNDINWLIEQAERVEELEELTTQMKYDVALFEKRTNEWLELKEQNKRYKQALEFYADKENYFLKQRMTSSFYTPIELDKGEKARQVLEGKE